MATEIRDAGGGLIGYQLSHTAQQVDDGLDAVATKAAQTDLAALQNTVDELQEDTESSINHRNIYRGKNLGTSVTEAQKAAIQSGTFDDLFIGDYWTINNVDWIIADMDYFYRVGNTNFTKHHLVIVPSTILYSYVMNDTNTTEGGYVGSKMYTDGLTEAKTIISAAFGNLVQSHKDYLVNAVSDGFPSAGAWYDSTVELMNEVMLYGCYHYASMEHGSSDVTKYATGKQQLSLFRLSPSAINIRLTYLLRDVVSSTLFAGVGSNGSTSCYAAGHSNGVRPYFVLGGTATT